jgi:hypothetical protein
MHVFCQASRSVKCHDLSEWLRLYFASCWGKPSRWSGFWNREAIQSSIHTHVGHHLPARGFPFLSSAIQSSPAPEPEEIGTFGTQSLYKRRDLPSPADAATVIWRPQCGISLSPMSGLTLFGHRWRAHLGPGLEVVLGLVRRGRRRVLTPLK